MFDGRPFIINAVSLCWKWAHNAVVSLTVCTVLAVHYQQLVAAGIGSMHYLCHDFDGLRIWKSFCVRSEGEESGKVETTYYDHNVPRAAFLTMSQLFGHEDTNR